MDVSAVRFAAAPFAGRAAAIAVIAALAWVSPQPAKPAPVDASVKQGQELAFDRGKGNCLACHQIAGGELAGNIGPALDNMRKRFPDRKELFGLIWNEAKRNPQTVMPAFGTNHILTEEEINQVINFLYSL